MKKWYIAAAGLLVIGFALFITLLVAGGGSNDNRVYVYFFNPYTMQMEAEIRSLPERDLQVQRVVEYLRAPSRSGNLVSTWPEELAPTQEDLISFVKLEDSALFVFFTPVFYDMQPLQQSLFKTAFIHTMRSIPSVLDIKMLVTDDYQQAYEMLMQSLAAGHEDEYASHMPLMIYDSSHAGVLIDPLDPPISPHWITDYTFNHLHFVDSSGTGLVVESYTVSDVNRQSEQLAKEMLEVLILGPRQEGVLSLIPSETRVLTVQIVGADIFVNLSGDFESRFVGNDALASLMIYSIVNTLLAEFTSPTRVHFMIDTLQIEQFHGVPDFHLAFEFNETLLMTYIAEQNYEYDPEEDE